MTITKPWPRSLPGQLALLVAIALFLAQAINFAIMLNGRQQLRHAQFTTPAVTMMVSDIDRVRSGSLVMRTHGRSRLTPEPPFASDRHDAPDLESELRSALRENGVTIGRINTVVRNFAPGDPHLRNMGRRRAARVARLGGEMRIAVEIPGKGWLRGTIAWPTHGNFLLWQLIAQTLIIYAVTLIPVFWLGRRISRPLSDLTRAARGFDPATPSPPVERRGPGDVESLITAFNHLSERVHAMLDEKDRMLGAIGHDLRTPLAALRVRIESVEDDTDRERMAEIIDEMHHMLEDILSLARLGRPSEPATEVDLSALVDAVVDDFRDIGAPVVAEETPRLRIRLRPSLMRRAVRNLIENAVKYGGGAEVRLIANATSASIEVADRGPGIPQDKLDTVFDPFTRLETSRNRETGGIGLGLALARAIVREAGGEIELANRDGGGLTATIRLPR